MLESIKQISKMVGSLIGRANKEMDFSQEKMSANKTEKENKRKTQEINRKEMSKSSNSTKQNQQNEHTETGIPSGLKARWE